jgi:hypothetical protein
VLGFTVLQVGLGLDRVSAAFRLGQQRVHDPQSPVGEWA